MSNNNQNSEYELSFILFIVFLVLKLTNNIDWSWWWVTSPLWIPIALVLSIVFIIFILVVIALLFGVKYEDLEKLNKFKKD
jgi:membrane protein YdbS with pleckstrin-like domain